eukprot:9530378-Lingulodinium_polyedra.AAC.1
MPTTRRPFWPNRAVLRTRRAVPRRSPSCQQPVLPCHYATCRADAVPCYSTQCHVMLLTPRHAAPRHVLPRHA